MFPDRLSFVTAASRYVAFTVIALAIGCTSEAANPVHTPPTGDSFRFTSAQVSSLDSTGQTVVAANPGNSSLRSLLDSTLLVLTGP